LHIVKEKENRQRSAKVWLETFKVVEKGTLNEKELNQAIKKFDTVDVQFMNVDEKVHFYFESLEANSSGPGGGVASPANPKSNIKGGALGYFSAHASQFQTIISD
jgi:hypothetical protein